MNKAKDDEKKRKCKNAIEDFGKIVDFGQTIQCRHTLFTKYFNEKGKPDCKATCDVCKDKKAAEKALEMFQMLSLNRYSAAVVDDDPSDLYGGNYCLVEFFYIY